MTGEVGYLFAGEAKEIEATELEATELVRDPIVGDGCDGFCHGLFARRVSQLGGPGRDEAYS